jgi:hydrogenase maturation protease
MDDFLGRTKRSAHEVGLIDLMDIARLTEHLPQNRALIGIQPDKMGWGMQPTTAVKNALDEAVDEAVKLINQWQKVSADQESSTPDDYSGNRSGVLR